ncbi:hypothetical protein [Tomitella fengzijianii]|uniref:hypothetical protein n=1 Tax=Tomitella fengzijianii TaxID=2597660 RepID=UPI001AEF69B5|nr:hypothetical protein [Tomitella fengzijianii]
MITGQLKSKIDHVWDVFWSGGIPIPLEVIELRDGCVPSAPRRGRSRGRNLSVRRGILRQQRDGSGPCGDGELPTRPPL